MTGILITLLWASAAWLTFGALASIASVGKPRKPLEHSVAVAVVITTAVIVGVLVSSAIVITGLT